MSDKARKTVRTVTMYTKKRIVDALEKHSTPKEDDPTVRELHENVSYHTIAEEVGNGAAYSHVYNIAKNNGEFTVVAKPADDSCSRGGMVAINHRFNKLDERVTELEVNYEALVPPRRSRQPAPRTFERLGELEAACELLTEGNKRLSARLEALETWRSELEGTG